MIINYLVLCKLNDLHSKHLIYCFYINDIIKKNSGKLEFKNLKLKRSALDILDLPVEVSHGCLQSLQVSVPWTALDRKPVRVAVDGLLLQAIPINVATLSRDELRERIIQSKRKTLAKIETELENKVIFFFFCIVLHK